MTLIAGRAGHGLGGGARARLARVGLGAGVAVSAARPVGDGDMGAGAGRGIAARRLVALVGGRTDHGRARARTGLASLALDAEVPVVARGSVAHSDRRARAALRIAAPGLTEARGRTLPRVRADTEPALARLGLQARVAVAARRAVALVRGRALTRLRVARRLRALRVKSREGLRGGQRVPSAV